MREDLSVFLKERRFLYSEIPPVSPAVFLYPKTKGRTKNESRTSRDNPQRLEYPCAGVCREYGGGGAVGAGMGFGTVRRR